MKRICFIFTFLLWLGCMDGYAAKVDTLNISSQIMQKTVKTAVVLPASYQASRQNYPVIYLLHGGQGNYRDWLTKTDDKLMLHKLADQYNFIIVTPDAGLMSYYFDSPLDKGSQYETFITKELVEKIDGTYRTVKDRKGRIIAGLSMGGHGAMYLSTRHPDMYCAAGSMSGVMNINTATWNVPPEFAKSRSANFEHLLGPPTDTANPYREYCAVGMVDKMKVNDVKLIFDCGFDDIMIKPNRKLHQLLLANGTPHDYIERPGKHDWPYWSSAVSYQFLFFQKVFLANGTIH
ncbi:alpha/beta hydrolase family protein [Mucilaginibacter sabulilitoris]|uniref:Alpha/beta hydrolase family protein n=1 Tax=Mucilaginibacter sabulilitoris TaxID=1173583 RepID=A0ABZ0THZ9_9SPHI|nr:alpha/beta hydrolase family protein [Mucilaginibacter sabulilitoris]WPU92241.1 alpha/beta hydrolase family protein [Mucilaginibacter sabulilitoris]